MNCMRLILEKKIEASLTNQLDAEVLELKKLREIE
jgi:hypothetical protein